ncbi:MAG: FHA domain-containing protein [Solirubrobacteraceae bacterium]
MQRYGASRKQIAHTLSAAYANGLLSKDTLAWRLDQLLEAQLVDPVGLVGDLHFRSPPRRLASAFDVVATAFARVRRSRTGDPDGVPVLLALDWSGGQTEITIGRHPACDVVLSGAEVSRRHARLFFRDGSWVVQDLQSTNGTSVNGVRVGRCALCPGDHLVLGDEQLTLD